MILRYSGPATFDGRLRQAAPPAHDEFQRLHDHAFATASGQLFPPLRRFFNARSVGHVHLLVRRREQQTIARLTNLCELLHVPDVIPLDMNLTFSCKQVKGRKLQVADRLNLPAVAAIRIHV